MMTAAKAAIITIIIIKINYAAGPSKEAFSLKLIIEPVTP